MDFFRRHHTDHSYENTLESAFFKARSYLSSIVTVHTPLLAR
jgi:hypothetical protein